jgi:hypothetical protein
MATYGGLIASQHDLLQEVTAHKVLGRRHNGFGKANKGHLWDAKSSIQQIFVEQFRLRSFRSSRVILFLVWGLRLGRLLTELGTFEIGLLHIRLTCGRVRDLQHGIRGVGLLHSQLGKFNSDSVLGGSNLPHERLSLIVFDTAELAPGAFWSGAQAPNQKVHSKFDASKQSRYCLERS